MELVFVTMALMEDCVNFVRAKMSAMEKEAAKTELVFVIKATEELIVMKDM